MNKDIPITILTPTYNREHTLFRLYNSLLNQKKNNFRWLIIDDGSTDNTEELVRSYSNKLFAIEYIKKDNGGKHTAINVGMKHVCSDLIMIVDSDDYLTPDATQTIESEWELVKEENLSGISFLMVDQDENINSKKINLDRVIANYNKLITNNLDNSDRAYVWNTKILKQYKFPEFPNEFFLSEGGLWAEIAKTNNMLFVNKAIYCYEYLDDGLTKSGRKLRIDNPNGGIYTAKTYLSNDFNLKVQTKQMILYITYSLFAGKSIKESFSHCPLNMLYLFLLPIGYGLFVYWKAKYDT